MDGKRLFRVRGISTDSQSTFRTGRNPSLVFYLPIHHCIPLGISTFTMEVFQKKQSM